MNTARALLLLGVTTALLLPGISVGGQITSSTVNFHGTLVAASCAADAIDVNFGDVALNTVNSTTTVATRSAFTLRDTAGASSKMFTMTVTCKGILSDGIQYRLDSAPSSFFSEAIPTDVTGLSILLANVTEGGSGYNVVPQTWYTLSGAGTYRMLAILYRDPSATFSGGDFTATTTLSMQLP